MNELLVKRIYNSMIGKKLISDSEMLQLKSAIDEFVGLDDGYECVNYDTMRKWYESEAGKELVESSTFQSYSFEGFYTYAAVEVLRDAGYSLDETIDLLR